MAIVYNRLSSALRIPLAIAAIVILGFILTGRTENARPELDSGHGRIRLRWFAWLQIGTTPTQIEALEEVVARFNAAQDEIELEL
jgi:hypothetical protein